MTKNYTSGQEWEYFNLREQQVHLLHLRVTFKNLQIDVWKGSQQLTLLNGCTLKSPRKLLKILKPRPIKAECIGGGGGISIFKSHPPLHPPRFQRAGKVENRRFNAGSKIIKREFWGGKSGSRAQKMNWKSLEGRAATSRAGTRNKWENQR